MHANGKKPGAPGRRPSGREPSPKFTQRDNRPTLRIIVVIAVVGCGAWLFGVGLALESVLLALLGLAFTGVTIARWVVDGAAMPPASIVLPHPAGTGGAA